MKTTKTNFLFLLLSIFLFAQVTAQETKVTLEFENAEIANKLIQNYTHALQEGDLDQMQAQLADNAMIYGLGGGLDSLNVAQHKEYFTESLKSNKHSIAQDLYLPVKVENNWNEGEWLLSWGTNTITNNETGNKIVVPYHTVSMIKDGKIVFIRYFYDMLNIVKSRGYTLTPPKE